MDSDAAFLRELLHEDDYINSLRSRFKSGEGVRYWSTDLCQERIKVDDAPERHIVRHPRKKRN